MLVASLNKRFLLNGILRKVLAHFVDKLARRVGARL